MAFRKIGAPGASQGLENWTNRGIDKKMTTKDKQALFLITFAACSGNISRTCDTVGIARQTFYNWMEDEDSGFADLIATLQFEAVERRIDLAEGKLDDRLRGGSGPDIRFVLKTLGAKRGYGAKQTVTVEPGAGFSGMEWPDETEDLEAWEAKRDAEMADTNATQSQQEPEPAVLVSPDETPGG
jgi:hypothetical protein